MRTPIYKEKDDGRQKQTEVSDGIAALMAEDYFGGATARTIAAKCDLSYEKTLGVLYKAIKNPKERMRVRRELMKSLAKDYATGYYTYYQLSDNYGIGFFVVSKLISESRIGDYENTKAIRSLRREEVANIRELKKRNNRRGLMPEEERRKNILDEAYQRCVYAGRDWTEDEMQKALEKAEEDEVEK